MDSAPRAPNRYGIAAGLVGGVAIGVALSLLGASWTDVGVELSVAVGLVGWVWLVERRLHRGTERLDMPLAVVLTGLGVAGVIAFVGSDSTGWGNAAISAGSALGLLWLLTALELAVDREEGEPSLVTLLLALPIALVAVRNLSLGGGSEPSREFDLNSQYNEWMLARELGGRPGHYSKEQEESPSWTFVEQDLDVSIPPSLRDFVDSHGGSTITLGNELPVLVWERKHIRVPFVSLPPGVVPFAHTVDDGPANLIALDLSSDGPHPVRTARIGKADGLSVLNFPLDEQLREDARAFDEWQAFRLPESFGTAPEGS